LKCRQNIILFIKQKPEVRNRGIMKLNKIIAIFLIIGLISSLALLSITSCSKNGDSGKSIEQQSTVSVAETSAEKTAPETTTVTTEVKKNYYISSSEEFPNYSFICPDGWQLLDSGNGSRILIKNPDGTDNKAESIYHCRAA